VGLTQATTLDGVRLKLERARAHATELDDMVQSILSATGEVITREASVNPSEAIFRISDVPRVDPMCSAIFGEGIYNLRSALDHLAWQLVLLDGGSPNESTQMPLYDSERDTKGRQRVPNIKPGIGRSDILSAIDQIQPYRRGGRWVDQLSVVNELSRIDKHRLLITVTTMLNTDSLFWGLPEGVPSPEWWFRVGQPLSDGDPVAKFLFRDAVAPNAFDPNLTVQIVLAEAPLASPYRLQGIAGLLSGLASITANRIDQFLIGLFPSEPPIWIPHHSLQR
jgi:hypothetical protein